MSMRTKVGSLAAPTTTGNVSVTGVGFKGKVVMFWMTRAAGGGFSAENRVGFGAASSSADRYCVAGATDDAATGAGSISGRRLTQSAIALIGGGGSVVFEADFVSWDTDGFTLNVLTGAAASGWTIHYMVLGGSSLTHAVVQLKNFPTVTGNQSHTGVGFSPDCLLFATRNSSGVGVATGFNLTIGAMCRDGTQGTIGFRDTQGVPSAVATYQRTDKAFAVQNTGTDGVMSFEATFVSMDTDGWTWNATSVPTGNDFIVIALKGGSFTVSSQNQKTSTGTQAKTGIGFAPAGMLAFSTNRAATTSQDLTVGKLSIGGVDRDGNQAGVWVSDTDAASPTDANSYDTSSAALAFATNPSTLDARARVTLRDDGWVDDWTTADGTARQYVAVLFGPAEASWTRVQQAVKNSPTVTGDSLAFPENVKAGNLLVAIVDSDAAGATIADSTGHNTWTLVREQGDFANDQKVAFYYAIATVSEALSVQPTFTAGSNFRSITIQEYSHRGGGAITLDQQTGATGLQQASETVGPITPTADDALVIATSNNNTDAYVAGGEVDAPFFWDGETTSGGHKGVAHYAQPTAAAISATFRFAATVGDWGGIIASFKVERGAVFPATGLLDDFNRADADALGPKWTELADVDLVSNQASFPGTGFAYCTSDKWEHVELWAKIPAFAGGLFSNLSARVVSSAAHANDPASTSAWEGVYLAPNASTDEIAVFTRIAGSSTQILDPIPCTGLADGDSVGMRVVGDAIEVYHKPAAGSWSLKGSRAISDGYTPSVRWPGRLAIAADSGRTLDDFGGGQFFYTRAGEYVGTGGTEIFGASATGCTPAGLPDNMLPGDTLFFIVMIDNAQTGTVKPPAGVFQVGEWVTGVADSYNTPALGVFRTRWDGSATSYAFTLAAGATRGGSIQTVCYRGNCAVKRYAAGTSASSTSDRSSPTLTGVATGNKVIAFHGGSAVNSRLMWSPPFRCRHDNEYFGLTGVADTADTGDITAWGKVYGGVATQSMWLLLEVNTVTDPTVVGYSTVDASAGNGSATVVVPDDATGAIAFWGHWDGNASSTLATLTLDGSSLTIDKQLAEGAVADANGVGAASLYTLPGTGARTLAWTWSAGGARSEGGQIAIIWIKNGVSTRDAQASHSTGIQNNYGPVTVNSQATDLVLGWLVCFGGGSPPDLGADATLINDLSLNSEQYDAGRFAAGASTTAVTAPVTNYPALLVISIAGADTMQQLDPDADLATTGWATAPLFSKINDASDATVITGAAS